MPDELNLDEPAPSRTGVASSAPVHDEAERGVIAACLLDSSVIDRARVLTGDNFQIPENRVIFQQIVDLHSRRQPVETATLFQSLKAGGRLTKAGGQKYIFGIEADAPTTALAGQHIETLRHRTALRRMVDLSRKAIDAADGANGEAPNIISEFQRQAAAIEVNTNDHLLTARGLMEFDVPSADDSNVLIGDRWLSRGDMAIMASTSGMGKSSLALQLGTLWSLGRDFYGGLTPRQPLKILVIQAEDNDGDIAEVRHSLTHALQLTVDEQAQVNSNVRIVTDRIHRGLSFRSELKHHIDDFHPDIVIINPLLAFIDGDVNSGEDVGRFVREQLNSLNEPASFAILIIHHTAKPPKEKSERRWNEVMYDMAGSADLTNAARAIISLRPLEAEGTFNLALPKRGRRAGYTELGKTGIHHTPVTVIGLRHSKERLTLPNGKTIPLIHWEKSEAKAEFQEPKNPGGRPPKYTFDQLRKYFPLPEAEPLPPAQIHRRFTGHVGISPSAFKDLCQRTAEDGFIEKMDRPLGVCYRLRHHPA